MEILKIKKIEFIEGKTVIDYKTFDVVDGEETEKTAGQWPAQEGELTNDQVVEFAKTMVEPGWDIEVSLDI